MQEIQPVIVTHLFPGLLDELIGTLESLSDHEWDLPTPCPGWTIHDLASHILGVEVSQLSLGRDGFRASLIDAGDWDDLVASLNEQNECWVGAMRGVSPRLLTNFIRSTGGQTSRYLQSLDPLLAGPIVSWASPKAAPIWLHIAREYTERWHHQQQIRQAVGKPLLTHSYWFSPLLATFVHGLPRSYEDVDMPAGSIVRVTISGPSGGTWLIVRTESTWVLRTDSPVASNAHITIGEIDAWRLFTSSAGRDEIEARVQIEGDRTLGSQALNTVSIIA